VGLEDEARRLADATRATQHSSLLLQLGSSVPYRFDWSAELAALCVRHRTSTRPLFVAPEDKRSVDGLGKLHLESTSVGPGWLIVERFVDQGWWHEKRFVLNHAGDLWVGSHWIGGAHIWNGKGLPGKGGTVAYNLMPTMRSTKLDCASLPSRRQPR
jgi:hypothetical protein